MKADDDQYRQCLAGSQHLRTLVAMMAQDGIDVVHVGSELVGGTPFVVMVVQGHFAEQFGDIAQRLHDRFAEEREQMRRDASSN